MIKAVPDTPRHVFADPVDVPAHQTPTGKPQTERTCVLCSVVKVTVHDGGGAAHREWRHPNDTAQFSDDLRPACVSFEREGRMTEFRPVASSHFSAMVSPRDARVCAGHPRYHGFPQA